MLDGACEGGGAVISQTSGLVPHVDSSDELEGFTSVESDFYPELAAYYAARFEAFFDTLRTDDVEGIDHRNDRPVGCKSLEAEVGIEPA